MNWTIIGIVVSVYLFTKSQNATAVPTSASNPLSDALNNAIKALGSAASSAAGKSSGGGGSGSGGGASLGGGGSSAPGSFSLANYLANETSGSNAATGTGTVPTTGLVASETASDFDFSSWPPYATTGNQDTSTGTATPGDGGPSGDGGGGDTETADSPYDGYSGDNFDDSE